MNLVSPVGPDLVSSIYLGGLGIVLIGCGFPRGDLLRLNLGLTAILALIVCRIFSENFSILTRSVVFLSLGALFLLTNVFLSRYFRTNEPRGKGGDHE